MDYMDETDKAWFDAAKKLCEVGKVDELLHMALGSIPECNIRRQAKFMQDLAGTQPIPMGETK